MWYFSYFYTSKSFFFLACSCSVYNRVYLIELVFSEHSKKSIQCSVGTLNYMLDAKLPIPPQCRTRLGHLKLMLFLGLQSSKVSAFAKWRRKASLLIKIHDHGISPVSRTIAQTRNTACVLTYIVGE